MSMNKTDCTVLHETVVRDIMDLWDTVKNMDADDLNGLLKTKKPMSTSSIAKAASNLTMVFPVICSRDISIETGSMISKAIEKRCVSMLQMLFASWQVADSGITSVQDYINQFHSNITTKVASLDDLFDIAARSESANTLEDSRVLYLAEKAIKNDMRNLDYYMPDPINETALTDYRYNEAAASVSGGLTGKDATDAKTMYEIEKLRKQQLLHTDEWDIAKKASDINKANSDMSKNKIDYFTKQVPDSEFKKANELMPTTMIVRFKVKTDKDEVIDYDSAVVGVKAKLYPIGSDDIINHLSEKIQNKNWIINFIRATTRETSFIKDFVLALDKAKIDAMSLSTRNSTSDKMWKVLERRATNSRLRRVLRQNNNASAITTLVISQNEVDYLKKYYNIDIEKLSVVSGLFESLNLMGFCIVDESLEVAKFIFDEADPSWETISFTHLERESNDNTYKKVVNLMTKVAR